MKYGAIGFAAFLLAPGLLEGGHWVLHILCLATILICAQKGGLFYTSDQWEAEHDVADVEE